MSTITLASAGNGTPGAKQWKETARVYTQFVDFAKILALKGSALAANDVIECIRLPAYSYVLAAGLKVIVPDNATTLTVDLGLTGVDADGFVDGFDHAAAAAGALSTQLVDVSDVGPNAIITATDTIDLLFATLTGTLSTGSCLVWAVVITIDQEKTPGLAQVGS